MFVSTYQRLFNHLEIAQRYAIFGSARQWISTTFHFVS